MLTRELAIASLDKGQVVPDRLTRIKHARYPEYAERMLALYRKGVGKTRQELHRGVHDIFRDEPECPLRRIAAFAKLLDDVSVFDRAGFGQAADLRCQVFRRAAVCHPLVLEPDRQFDHAEAEVKAQIAREMGQSWEEIDRQLFADVMEFHCLQEFTGYPNPQALLARYNVAQVQAALFDGVSLTVWAEQDFKVILRYAKLARLMHTIQRAESGYVFHFDGPASVLRQTRRYGVAMAQFLPALLACQAWRMHALVRVRGRWNASLDLSAADGLTSHLPVPEEFDSQVEEDFAHQWGTDSRSGWNLIREGEVLHAGQKVFVPDFVFRHEDGRKVLLEIVGFWTPEYLEAKLKTLRTFAGQNILVAVAAGNEKRGDGFAPDAIRFKKRLRIKDVLQRLESKP